MSEDPKGTWDRSPIIYVYVAGLSYAARNLEKVMSTAAGSKEMWKSGYDELA